MLPVVCVLFIKLIQICFWREKEITYYMCIYLCVLNRVMFFFSFKVLWSANQI